MKIKGFELKNKKLLRTLPSTEYVSGTVLRALHYFISFYSPNST